MISSFDINTEGVRQEKRQEAKEELLSLITKVFRKEISIKVIVAKDFKAAVNYFLEGKVKIPYDPKHSKSQAIAKTIPYLSNNKLHFALIIDGAVFGEWKTEEKISRSLTLGHEIVHMKDFYLLFKEMGAKPFSEPQTLQELMFNLAYDLWIEYHAERTILEISKELTSKNKKLTFDPTLSLDRIEDLKQILEEILPFLQKKIMDFRKWQLTIVDLWETAYLRIREMLVLASYVSAISDSTGDFKAEIEGMSNLIEYQFIFKGVWEKIRDEFKSAYKKKNFPKTEIENIALDLKSIFHRCGFELKDVKNRLWLEPHEISL